VQEGLRTEARVLGRHLVGVEPAPELVERYVVAHASALTERPSARDAAWLAFALRNPRAVGPLDAALGLLRPRALPRRKLLLLTAILEATTTHAPVFLERRLPPARLVLALAWLGLVAGARLAVGLPLLVLVGRRAR